MEETMRTLRPEKQRRRPKIAVLLVTLCAAALLSYAALTGTLAAPKQLAGARTQLPAAAASAPSFFGWAAAAVYRTFCPYVSDCDVEHAALNSSALPTTVARVALWREPTPRYSSTMVEVLEPPRTSHSRPRPASSPFRTHPPLHSPLARSGSPASPHPVSALTRTARCTRPRPARSPPSPASSIFRKSQIRPPTPFWSTAGAAAPTALSTSTAATLYSGTPGQTLAYLNGAWIGAATTTLSNGTGITTTYSAATNLADIPDVTTATCQKAYTLGVSLRARTRTAGKLEQIPLSPATSTATIQ